MVCSWQEPEIQTLQDKLFYHFLTNNDCIKEKYPQPCPIHHSAWVPGSPTAAPGYIVKWHSGSPPAGTLSRRNIDWLSYSVYTVRYLDTMHPLKHVHVTKQIQRGQLLQKTIFLACALPWLPLPTTTGISGELSAAEICLELSMSFQKKLLTSFGCTSNSNTSCFYHLDLYIYTCSIKSEHSLSEFSSFSNFFLLDGLFSYVMVLALSNLPFLPRYQVSFLLASKGLKESCKTGMWVNTLRRVPSMMLWLSEVSISTCWVYSKIIFLKHDLALI